MTRPITPFLEMEHARQGGLYTIGETAKASGISAKMIRHYESIGLIESIRRTHAGYRVYSEKDIETLQFIYRSRELGFPLEQIKELLTLWHNKQRASKEVQELAQCHVEALNKRILEMEAMRKTLEYLIQECPGNQKSDCPILDELASPNTNNNIK